MKSLYAGILLVCCSACEIAAAEDGKGPKIGEPAPPLDLQKVLQAPPGKEASWEALRGKVVVLEFWATWCAPCVAAIPHMNELVDTFKDRPVQFLAVTDEDEATAKEFLGKRPIGGWVGLNTKGSMFKSYGVEAIPHTVIVGANGKIAAITYPQHVEARHLENVIAGRDSGLPLPSEDIDPPTVPAGKPSAREKEELPAVFQFVIRPSAGTASGWTAGRAGRNDFGIVYESNALGITAESLVASTYGVTGSRLIVEAPLPEGRFDALFRAPDDSRKEMEAVRRQVVEATFGLTSRRESREIDVYVLTVKTPDAKGLQPTVITSQGRSMNSALGSFEAVNCTIESWANSNLEFQLKKPVFDETGLKGGYDFQLKWEAGDGPARDPDKLIAAVREQLGLELSLTKRPVEVVVVMKRAKP
jgi:uncharacterized protein (TIGR03435 family)